MYIINYKVQMLKFKWILYVCSAEKNMLINKWNLLIREGTWGWYIKKQVNSIQ